MEPGVTIEYQSLDKEVVYGSRGNTRFRHNGTLPYNRNLSPDEGPLSDIGQRRILSN